MRLRPRPPTPHTPQGRHNENPSLVALGTKGRAQKSPAGLLLLVLLLLRVPAVTGIRMAGGMRKVSLGHFVRSIDFTKCPWYTLYGD